MGMTSILLGKSRYSQNKSFIEQQEQSHLGRLASQKQNQHSMLLTPRHIKDQHKHVLIFLVFPLQLMQKILCHILMDCW